MKCIIAGCEMQGTPEPGYRFFMCAPHLNSLEDLCVELDNARNDGRESLAPESYKL